jgi:hypothetical protein
LAALLGVPLLLVANQVIGSAALVAAGIILINRRG